MYPLLLLVIQNKSHITPKIGEKYPPTPSLLSHFLSGKITLESGWIKEAFSWEKKALYHELTLYYFCQGDKKKAAHFEDLREEEEKKAQIALHFI